MICDEGIGGQMLELPYACCSAEGGPASAPSDEEGGEAPCGPCVDVPMVQVHQADDDLQEPGHPELAFIATIPDTPPARLCRGVAFTRHVAPPGARPTVARLTGTVVQLC